MKIMFNTSSLGKGGAERVISVLSNSLIENNDVIILVNTKENQSYYLDDRIRVLPLDKKYNSFASFRNLKRTIDTYKVIKKEKPDIIISFLPIPSFRILLLKGIVKTPIIISDRNNPADEYKSPISKFLMKWLYKRANGFVFQTTEQKLFFNEKIQKKSVIIPNPIKEEFLNTDNDVKKENTIISVGRLVPQKNQKMLINAFSRITKTYQEYCLKIYGNGNLKDELQEQINNLGIEDSVKLCGISDDIKTELQKSKIFVLPSNYEGMPNALIEAMTLGLPVISTDCPCGGPKELIKDGENGLLIKVGAEDELYEKMKYLLNNDNISFKLGDEAKKIKEKLLPEEIARKWEDYIREIAG